MKMAKALLLLLATLSVPASSFSSNGEIDWETVENITGRWVLTGSLDCSANRVCADWLDDRTNGIMGSCCLLPGFDLYDADLICPQVWNSYVTLGVSISDGRDDDDDGQGGGGPPGENPILE